MSDAVIPVHISGALLSAVTAQAGKRGQSIEDWLLALVARQVREEELSERYFGRAAERSPEENRKALADFLKTIPDNPPMPGDELPEGWSSDHLR